MSTTYSANDSDTLTDEVNPLNDVMRVGVRHIDDTWEAEAEYAVYSEVTKVKYRHDNEYGERVFVVTGEDVPGYFEWVTERNIMFIDGGWEEEQ